jgi:hypothetical protein
MKFSYLCRLVLLISIAINMCHSRDVLATELVSPINFEVQNSKWSGSLSEFSCSSFNGIPSKVQSVKFYTDSRSSIIDETRHLQFMELRKPIDSEENFLSQANTALIRSSAHQRASIRQCILKHLLGFAADNAFVDSDDIQGSGVVRLMSVTPLVSYLLLRDSGEIAMHEDVEIREWIARLMERLMFWQSKTVYNNNIDDWTVAASALGAVALNNPDMLSQAISALKGKAGKITSDGVLPQEINRGVMAVDYSLSATQALAVTIAVAQANDIHVLRSSEGLPLIKMMSRMIHAIAVPSSFVQYASEPGALEEKHFDRQSMGWAEVYFQETNDLQALDVVCRHHPLYSWRSGGDWFVFFGSPDQCSMNNLAKPEK